MKKILSLILCLFGMFLLVGCEANAEIYEIDGVKYVNYGSYPQTHVGDTTLIAELNKLTETNDRGYYEYEGNEYAKIVANSLLYG